MAMDTRSEFLTKDLQIAASLLASNAKLIRLDQESNISWFVFENKSLCEKLIIDFWNNELQVSAKAYSNALKELKDRLFSKRET